MTLFAAIAPAPPVPGAFMAFSKTEAGELLRKKREDKGLTQEQVCEQVGIPTITQLSEYETGKVNVARSKYLPKLARVLGLSEDEVRSINPSAVFEQASPSSAASAAAKGYVVPRHDPEPIPDALLEAADLYGGAPEFAELREYRWQRYLADIPFRSRPTTAAEWLRVYLNRKDEVDPREPDA